MAGYGTDLAFASWLTLNGYDLPLNAKPAAVLRQRGSQYVDATYGARFVGVPVAFNQERSWPRVGAFAGRMAIPSEVVPSAIETASYYAAYQEALKPGSLSAIGSPNGAIKRKKVGTLEIEYQDGSADGSAAGITPQISTIDGMLAAYLVSSTATGLGLWAVGC